MGILLRTISSLVVSVIIVGFLLLVTSILMKPDWFVNFWEIVGMISFILSIALAVDKYNFRG